MVHVVTSICRKLLQRSGKDHSVLLVLPSGIYHYKFYVDGEWRYIPDLPFVADEMGHVCNLLDVHVCVLLTLYFSSIFNWILFSSSYRTNYSRYVLGTVMQACILAA
jgi:hypothetical protein